MSSRRFRRRWSAGEKEQVVAASLQPGLAYPRWRGRRGLIRASSMGCDGNCARDRNLHLLRRCGLRENRRGLPCRDLAPSPSTPPVPSCPTFAMIAGLNASVRVRGDRSMTADLLRNRAEEYLEKARAVSDRQRARLLLVQAHNYSNVRKRQKPNN